MQASAEKIWGAAQEQLRSMLNAGHLQSLVRAVARRAPSKIQSRLWKSPMIFAKSGSKTITSGLLQDVLAFASRPAAPGKIQSRQPGQPPSLRRLRRRKTKSSSRRAARAEATHRHERTGFQSQRTPSIRLSSATTTISPTPPRWRWPKRRANPTIRCSCMAASVWARRICSTPSANMSPRTKKGARGRLRFIGEIHQRITSTASKTTSSSRFARNIARPMCC